MMATTKHTRAGKAGKRNTDTGASWSIYATRPQPGMGPRASVAENRPRDAVSRSLPRPGGAKTRTYSAVGVDFAPRRRAKGRRTPALASQAVDAVLALAASQAGGSRADAIAKLRQAVHHDAIKRPRHAAVALALVDVLICARATLDVQQTEALRRAALALLEPYISTADERGVLTSLARAGLERVPPLDEGPLAVILP